MLIYFLEVLERLESSYQAAQDIISVTAVLRPNC